MIMICPRCHKDIQLADAAYCPYCAASLADKKRRTKRSNGLGTAIRRGKTWTARVVIAWRPTEDGGKRAIYRTKGGFRTKKEALEHCVILKGMTEAPRKAPQLIAYWDTYEAGELAQLSKSKQSAYRTAWRKLSVLHYLPVDAITVANLRDAVSSVASTYYTAKDCKTVLTKLFTLAGADGFAQKELPDYIVLPKLQETERDPFTAEEQAALWQVYESGDVRAAIPLIMIYTGMMPGEAQALKTEHIDLDARTITGVGLKTKVRRTSSILLPDAIVPVLADQMQRANANGYLWPRNEDQWYADYYAALEAAGCRRLTPYSCRHTTATSLAITEGIAPQTLKRIMRWSTSKMADRYVHPDDTAAHEAVNTLRPVGNT